MERHYEERHELWISNVGSSLKCGIMGKKLEYFERNPG